MKIICFGDSNTYGYDPRGPFGGRYEEPWPELLENTSGWTVINEGENGREIPRLTPSFPEDTDVLIIMLGTNDLLMTGTPEAVCDRMDQFLSHLSLKKVLLLAPPTMTPGAWVPGRKLLLDSLVLAENYRALALRHGIRFVDTACWKIPIAYDGVHFTEDGHRIFAENLYLYLQNMME